MTLSDDLLALIYQSIALLGVLVAVLGWRGRRPAARWCPACGEDLSDTESKRCVACGFTSPREIDFRRRRRSWGVLITGLLVVATASGFAVASGVAGTPTRMLGRTWMPVETRSLPNGWIVEHDVSRDFDRTSFARRIRVLRDGQSHFVWTGRDARLGFDGATPGRREGLGTDIDRNGEPDLVLEIADGGDARRRRWLVLSLADRTAGARLEPVAVLRDGRFEDVDGDGRPEFLASDPELVGQWAGSGIFEVPEVVLRPEPEGWRFDRTLTAALPLPIEAGVSIDDVLAKAATAWRQDGTPFVSPLFGLVLHLTARDRIDEAMVLLRSPWPGEDDPGSVTSLETIIDPASGLSRRYVPTPEGREAVWRDLLARWRWGDRFGPTSR